MDFASLMSAQIAKASKQSSTGPDTSSGAKYLKRSDIEAARQREYAAKQQAAQHERAAKQAEKRKLEDLAAVEDAEREAKRARLAEQSRRIREEEDAAAEKLRRKRIGLPELPAVAADTDQAGDESGNTQATTSLKAGQQDIPEETLLLKLRDIGHPARLFAETHQARLRRYYALVEKASAPVLSTGPIPTSLALVAEKDMKVPDSVPKDAEGRAYLYRQLGSYFTMVLIEWNGALAGRDEVTKQSSAGQSASAALHQAQTNMVPLFRRLEQNNLEDSILGPVTEIVRSCQNRQYVAANDAYLRLSIGKAAWPIGVTMVGIHERSARERLNAHEKDTAHIMADEGTRKWLQSIKRCLSYAQTRWPADDGGWV